MLPSTHEPRSNVAPRAGRRSLARVFVGALALVSLEGGCRSRRGIASETSAGALPDEAPARARHVRVPELTLRVVELGSPRARSTRVVVHATNGLDHTYLRPWLDALSDANARVLYVDLRGHGRSDLPPDASGYGLAPAAADLAALIERECDGRAADVIAHDSGAAVALSLALNHPERVARLVLVAPVRDGAQLRASNSRVRAALGEDAARRLDALRTPQGTLRDARALTEATRLLGAAWFARTPPRGALERLARDALYRDEADAHFAMALSRYDARAIAPDVRALTLVVAGAEDRVIPAAESRALAAALPHGQYVEIAAAGHLPFVEQHLSFVRAVTTFLRGPASP